MSKTIKVEYYKDEEFNQQKDKKDLSWPQKYEDFIQDIIKNFSLNKKSKIFLQLITEDEDDVTIDSQEGINDYQEDNKIKEFKFYLENSDDDEISDSEGGGGVGEDEKKNFVGCPEGFEVEGIDVDNIIKDIFNKDEYDKKMKADFEEYTNNFTSNLKQSIDNTLNEQKNTIKNDIALKINDYSKLSLNIHKENNNKILDLQEDLGKIKDEADSLSLGVDQLCDGINSNELVLSRAENISKIILKKKNSGNNNNINNINNNNNNLQISEIKNNNLKREHNVNPLDEFINENEEENDDDGIKIKFEKNKIERIIDIKESNFFNINNIKFTNIGNKSLKHLKFIKDIQNSSDEIYFFGNSKNIDELELTMDGELQPNNEQNTAITLNIKNGQPDQIYKMIIYVREKNKDKNISEPFELNIKINKAEDPNQQRINIANKIYEEILNEYPNHEKLINKNAIINKLLNNNLDKDEIKNEINIKIKQNEANQNQNKAEEIYDELNINNINIDKKEIIDYIIQNNFDKDIVQNWINDKIEEQNKTNAEDIYNKLSQLNDVDFSKSNKDDIIKKIIELNFNEDEIKKLYEKKAEPVPDPAIPNPAPVPVRDDDEKVDKIYDDLEEEYGISGFIDEDAAKEKIRQLECDRERINQWIEEELINGGG